MDAAYREVIGFTPQEVAQMAEDLTMAEALPDLKKWYDGYLFGGAEIYNPWSIINFSVTVRLMTIGSIHRAMASSGKCCAT